MSTHIRINKDVSAVIETLTNSGLFPRLSGRSAAHVANELIRESPTFLEAQKQAASEKHPKPGQKNR